MEAELYYTPPSDEVFDELKNKSIQLWKGYDNTHGYVTEKVGRIKDIPNVGDNFMYMVAMFDNNNQKKLSDLLSDETKEEVRKRLIDGGLEPTFNHF